VGWCNPRKNPTSCSLIHLIVTPEKLGLASQPTGYDDERLSVGGMRRTVTFHGVNHGGDLVWTECPAQVNVGSAAEDCHRRHSTLYFEIHDSYSVKNFTIYE
jgi:hypothetical protein